MVTKVVIAGGGIAGVSSAEAIADHFHKLKADLVEFERYIAHLATEAGVEITLIEYRDKLLSGSSNNTPCRDSIGLHYIDPKPSRDLPVSERFQTARQYLRHAILIARKYSTFIDQNSRGRYFLVRQIENQFPIADIHLLHAEIAEEYKNLIKEDPSNKVLGEPDDISRALTPDEYKNDVNTSIVVAAYETAERTLKWPALKAHLIDQISRNPKIKILCNHEVLSIKHGDTSRFVVTTREHDAKDEKKAAVPKKIETDFVIVSAWENNRKLVDSLGYRPDASVITNRLKVMIEVELPNSMVRSKSSPNDAKEIVKQTSNLEHPMFFCFGPHAAFTPHPENPTRAFVTFEPVTNIKYSLKKDETGQLTEDKDKPELTTALEISSYAKRLLQGGATLEEKEYYSKKIIEGATRYIPKLKDSKSVDVRFGIVQTDGTVDINSPTSAHHSRTGDGIKSVATGILIAPARKLLWFPTVAEKVWNLLVQHIKAAFTIENALKASHFNNHKENLQRGIIRAIEAAIVPELLFNTNPQKMQSDAKTNQALKSPDLKQHKKNSQMHIAFASKTVVAPKNLTPTEQLATVINRKTDLLEELTNHKRFAVDVKANSVENKSTEKPVDNNKQVPPTALGSHFHAAAATNTNEKHHTASGEKAAKPVSVAMRRLLNQQNPPAAEAAKLIVVGTNMGMGTAVAPASPAKNHTRARTTPSSPAAMGSQLSKQPIPVFNLHDSNPSSTSTSVMGAILSSTDSKNTQAISTGMQRYDKLPKQQATHKFNVVRGRMAITAPSSPAGYPQTGTNTATSCPSLSGWQAAGAGHPAPSDLHLQHDVVSGTNTPTSVVDSDGEDEDKITINNSYMQQARIDTFLMQRVDAGVRKMLSIEAHTSDSQQDSDPHTGPSQSPSPPPSEHHRLAIRR